MISRQSAAAALQAVRKVGGDLFLAGDELRFRAPKGFLPDDVREALRVHRDKLRQLIVDEQRWLRCRVVTRALTELNASMAALGPWTPAEVAECHGLAERVDNEARAFIASEVADDLAFFSALAAWEVALRAEKAPPIAPEPAGASQGALFGEVAA